MNINTDGYVSITVLGCSRFAGSTMDGDTKVELLQMVASFPTSPYKCHLLKSPNGLGERVFFRVLLPIIISGFALIPKNNFYVHVWV
jgi:hypothetical protein